MNFFGRLALMILNNTIVSFLIRLDPEVSLRHYLVPEPDPAYYYDTVVYEMTLLPSFPSCTPYVRHARKRV